LRKQLLNPALATGQFIQSFCLHYVIAGHGISYHSNIKFYLEMNNSSDAVLIKQDHCSSEIVYRLARSSAIFDECVIKTISSDAESREEQDGGKHLFV